MFRSPALPKTRGKVAEGLNVPTLFGVQPSISRPVSRMDMVLGAHYSDSLTGPRGVGGVGEAGCNAALESTVIDIGPNRQSDPLLARPSWPAAAAQSRRTIVPVSRRPVATMLALALAQAGERAHIVTFPTALNDPSACVTVTNTTSSLAFRFGPKVITSPPGIEPAGLNCPQE